MLSVVQYLSLLVFATYFTINLGLLYVVGISIKAAPGFARLTREKRAWRGTAGVHLALAVISFFYTWFYMIQYLKGSYSSYRAPFTENYLETHQLHVFSSWLADSSLFKEAWATVCNGWSNWWWSEQLCIFTVGGWTTFLFLEGHKRRIAHLWAYMLLGQLVAISVTSNLFYTVIALSPETKTDEDEPDDKVPSTLSIPVMLSMGTIALSPYTSDASFLPNLLAMHALLLIPFLIPDSSHRILESSSPIPAAAASIFYGAISLLTIILRLRSSRVPFHHDLNRGNPPQYLPYRVIAYHHWETLHSHPAQSSIGWDVIWTTASFLVAEFMRRGDKRWTVGLSSLLTVLWGVGFAAPAMWALSSL